MRNAAVIMTGRHELERLETAVRAGSENAEIAAVMMDSGLANVSSRIVRKSTASNPVYVAAALFDWDCSNTDQSKNRNECTQEALRCWRGR